MTPLLWFLAGMGTALTLMAAIHVAQGMHDARREAKADALITAHIQAVAAGDVAAADQTQAELKRLGYQITTTLRNRKL